MYCNMRYSIKRESPRLIDEHQVVTVWSCEHEDLDRKDKIRGGSTTPDYRFERVSERVLRLAEVVADGESTTFNEELLQKFAVWLIRQDEADVVQDQNCTDLARLETPHPDIGEQ